MAELVLKTEIDIKKAEKDLEKLKKELQQYDNEAKKLTKQKAEISGSESFKQYRQEMTKLLEEQKKAMQNPFYGVDPYTTRITDDIQRDIDQINEKYKETIQPLNEIDSKLEEIKKTQDNTNGSVNKYKDAITKAKQEIQDEQQEEEKAGKGFEKGIKSLKRFALSLFGVQSAFGIVRRAMNTYLNQHEDTANKISSIWTALGNALGPIIEIIADMVLKLIGYLNVFLQALGWDVDLTKGMGKSKKAIEGTTGAMKELNNQVASFDEMNVMQKDTSSGGSGGIDNAGGFEMPELDEGVVNILKDCAKWLKENWDWISKILLLIAGIKIAKWLGGLGAIGSMLSTLATIGVIAIGVDLLYDAITGRNLIQDLKDIKEGFEAVQKANKDNTKANKENGNETRKLIATKKEENKQYEINSQELNDNYNFLRQTIEAEAKDNEVLAKKVDKMTGVEYWYERQIGTIDDYNERLADNNDTMRDAIQGMVDMYNAGQLNEQQQEELFKILDSVNATIEDGTVKYEDMDNHVLDASKHIGDYTAIVEAAGRKTDDTATNVEKSWWNISEKSNVMKQNIQNNWGDITNTIFNKMREVDGTSATVSINADGSQFQDTINKIGNLTGVTNFMGTGIANAFKFFRLATGGIVYNPGRGVPLVGEATNGPEGVVPLNNEQSMDLIGQSIARHLVVNLTNTTTLDGKVIAREQRKLQEETNFATNGRGV